MPTSTFQVSQEAPDSPALDVEKTEVEQVENVLPRTPYQSEEPGPASILNWLQKKNPSPQFLADVAKMNETELDAGKVKHVERKIDLLIMPALAICYMVRPSSLSFA